DSAIHKDPRAFNPFNVRNECSRTSGEYKVIVVVNMVSMCTDGLMLAVDVRYKLPEVKSDVVLFVPGHRSHQQIIRRRSGEEVAEVDTVVRRSGLFSVHNNINFLGSAPQFLTKLVAH